MTFYILTFFNVGFLKKSIFRLPYTNNNKKYCHLVIRIVYRCN